LKRDVDLIRQIILQAEQANEKINVGAKFKVKGYDDILVAKHIELLVEAGLLKARFTRTDTDGVVRAYVERLTWDGHEFLDAARNESVWNKAKVIIKEKVGTVSFEVLKTLLIKISKSLLNNL
jgi:hypothetical protein